MNTSIPQEIKERITYLINIIHGWVKQNELSGFVLGFA